MDFGVGQTQLALGVLKMMRFVLRGGVLIGGGIMDVGVFKRIWVEFWVLLVYGFGIKANWVVLP